MSSRVDKIKRLLIKATELSIKELNGMLILLPLILLIIFSQPIYRAIFDKQLTLENSAKLDSLLATIKVIETQVPMDYLSPVGSRLPFNFDPNTATYNELLDLGFNRLNANRIIAYRNKGGTYKYKEDLLRIHEIDSLLTQNLWNYILLPGKPEITTVTKKAEIKSPILSDINIADTVSLKKIYGIGSVLSSRIITYRDKLGGFISMEQLHEVYGLKPEVIESLKNRFIVSEDFTPFKVNINKLDENQLAQHPYLDRKTARAIIAFRSQHGAFASAEELSKIYLINDNLLNKILPYIEI
jgi:competence protein ComEA